MHFQIPVLVTVTLIVIIIQSGTTLTGTSSHFGTTTNFAYGQTNQTNTNNPLNIQNMPIKKIHVGDIDIAYKTFGKGDPILLIDGLSMKMDSWEPSI